MSRNTTSRKMILSLTAAASIAVASVASQSSADARGFGGFGGAGLAGGGLAHLGGGGSFSGRGSMLAGGLRGVTSHGIVRTIPGPSAHYPIIRTPVHLLPPVLVPGSGSSSPVVPPVHLPTPIPLPIPVSGGSGNPVVPPVHLPTPIPLPIPVSGGPGNPVVPPIHLPTPIPLPLPIPPGSNPGHPIDPPPVVDHHHHHHHWAFIGGVWVVVDDVTEEIVPADPEDGPAPGPCTCLTKTYTPSGLVVFADVCTKESASASVYGNASAEATQVPTTPVAATAVPMSVVPTTPDYAGRTYEDYLAANPQLTQPQAAAPQATQKN